MNLIDKSEAAHRRKCIREQLLKDAQKLPRVTKASIVKEIQSRYPTAQCQIGKTALGKGVIEVTGCWHGDCERIGQWMLKCYGKQVYTYFACHIFRKGRLAIYFKR